MINNAYKIELKTDDGTGYAKFWRYYNHKKGRNEKFGLSAWTGKIETVKNGFKYVEHLNFPYKENVLHYLRLKEEFAMSYRAMIEYTKIRNEFKKIRL